MAHLGPNRYGKDGIRLVLVRRPAPGSDGADELRDLTVDVRLAGDFDRVHTEGDNATVLPTDTMRSTVYALAQERLTGALEDFGLALAARFLAASPAAVTAEITLREHAWDRISVAGNPHPHAFVGGGDECATALVRSTRSGSVVLSGLTGLRVLKTTGSAFSGFLRDELTVLEETDDRIMATEVSAEWEHDPGSGQPYDEVRAKARTALVARFATQESESVQHTLYAMGSAVLDACPTVVSVRLLLPNKHHVLADLAAVGIANDRAVYVATDRPFGVIEGTVERSP